ncbi:MAG: hypothetical protein R3Y49_00305 [Rikenellaceae bacterium]
MKHTLKSLVIVISLLCFASCETEKDFYDSLKVASFLTEEQVVDADTPTFTIECRWSDGFTESSTVQRGLPLVFDAEKSTAKAEVPFIYNEKVEFTPTPDATLITEVELVPENITEEVVLYYDLHNGYFEGYPYPIIERHKITLKPSID